MEESPRPHRSSSLRLLSTRLLLLLLLSFSQYPLILSLKLPPLRFHPFHLPPLVLSHRALSLFPNVRPLSLRPTRSFPSLRHSSLSALTALPCQPREEVHFREKRGKRREKSMRDVDWPHTAGFVPTFVRGALMGVA